MQIFDVDSLKSFVNEAPFFKYCEYRITHARKCRLISQTKEPIPILFRFDITQVVIIATFSYSTNTGIQLMLHIEGDQRKSRSYSKALITWLSEILVSALC